MNACVYHVDGQGIIKSMGEDLCLLVVVDDEILMTIINVVREKAEMRCEATKLHHYHCRIQCQGRITFAPAGLMSKNG